MNRRLRTLCVVALSGLPVGVGAARARSGDDCRPQALAHLQAAAPGGFAIYKQIGDTTFFASWINCDDAQFDLSTAVHESTHRITAETDAFPLVGGGAVARPHEVSAFFAPARIAKRFEADDFVKIYLRRGKASSATDFLFLLDELNAYSHDLETAVDLKDLTKPDEAVDHRDGLAAMMAFVAIYAETARNGDPGTREALTWRGLRAPRVARTISELWARAERVISSSCGIPNFGTRDTAYVRKFCAQGAQAAMTQVTGGSPVCPAACLDPKIDLIQARR